jgi:hypothetical protein
MNRASHRCNAKGHAEAAISAFAIEETTACK